MVERGNIRGHYLLRLSAHMINYTNSYWQDLASQSNKNLVVPQYFGRMDSLCLVKKNNNNKGESDCAG